MMRSRELLVADTLHLFGVSSPVPFFSVTFCERFVVEVAGNKRRWSPNVNPLTGLLFTADIVSARWGEKGEKGVL
jgi:hypothetical protein